MNLDYTGKDFVLRLARGEGDPREFMQHRGLDYSTPASTPSEAILYTKEAWGVADLGQHATPAALKQIEPIAKRIAASRAPTSGSHFKMPADQELWGFQKASLDYLLSGSGHGLIADEPGLGKEQDVNEPVLTPSGWVPIGHLKVGDAVFAADGTTTQVIGVFPQGVKPSYRINFRDGTFARSGHDHLWRVHNHAWKDKKWRVMSLREIVDSGLTMPRGNRKNPRYSVQLCEPVRFPFRWLPVEPYTLGVLLGDGCLTGGRIEFSNPDIDCAIREEVERRLPSGYHLVANRHPACPSYRITRPGQRTESGMMAGLRQLGVCVRSADKFIPQNYLEASVEQRLDLLRGLMDTDGSCAKNRTTFHTISPALAADVAALVRSLGGQAIVREYDRSKSSKPIEYQVNVKMALCPFLLPRKATEWRPQEGLRKSIWSVEHEGEEEQVCIRIAHPSQLYITRDYTVTHNTPQAIVYANEIGAKRVLVICPAAIRTQWARKIEEWSTMLPPRLIYPVFNAKNGVHPNAQWVILSYALARNPGIVAAIAKQRFDLVIMDESHYLKDIDSYQTRAILGQADGQYHPKGLDPIPAIISRAANVLFLSGTPIVNRPLEAYTTTRALAWDAIDYASLDKFRVRYNPQKEIIMRGGKRIKQERIGRVVELGNRMRGTFMARHAKREVMTQLKFPRYEVIQYEETKDIKRLIEAESLLGIDIDAVQTTTDYEMLGHIATLRREMGIATAPQAAEYVRTLLEGGVEKIVVFGWHIEVLTILQQKLVRYGVVRIDGSTTGKARQAGVDSFITAPNIRVMLGNIQSMGVGVDGLQKVSQRCVLVEPSWTPGDNQQAIDRLDRGGQLGSVQADFLVPPGSIIEKILVAALKKAKIIHETLK